ncbi:MAG TPA: DUF2292 domain-containing protein [Pelotomaculum sp.]|jgi:hypothetical protein|nr:DUF2292 domain-containing protein [Pelotomaculum sp.]
MSPKTNGVNPDRTPISQLDLKKLLEMVKTVSHGSITLIIHDGKIVQIDKSEKLRLK